MEYSAYIGILILGTIIINIVWYSAKSLSLKNGLEAHTFKKHWLEYPNMYKLAFKAESPKTRFRAKVYLVLLIVLPITLFTLVWNGAG
jgi:hypothetical protein